MNGKVYGIVRHKPVVHEMPVVLNSGVSLGEAVEIWMDSIKEAGRVARLCRELDMWRGSGKDRR
jgi:hypothetical protein